MLLRTALSRGWPGLASAGAPAPALRSSTSSGCSGLSRSCCSSLRRGTTPVRWLGAAAQPSGTAPRPPTAALAEDAVEHAAVMPLLEQSLGPLSSQPMVAAPQPKVLVISGPSGVGKDAVIKRLQQMRPDLYFVVTATSRPMRPGEVEGKDYFFVSKATFESWMRQGELLEHAVVYGEYKGIPRHQVDAALQQGNDVVLRIDVQGAATVRQLMPQAVSVFIVADSEQQLVQRLVSRKTEPLDRMLTRVQTARAETQRIGEFDYVVVNREGQLEACVQQICAIIDAEKLRTAKQRG